MDLMDCGHPLSARRITWSETGKRLITDCWACAVQQEVVSKIVGPKAKTQRDVA